LPVLAFIIEEQGLNMAAATILRGTPRRPARMVDANPVETAIKIGPNRLQEPFKGQPGK
jgi:hypothetical protein